MALNRENLVDLPERGIAYKKVSGKTYVYYVTATYRNAKGQPTCDRSSIGRLDEETGKLIPNRNYYEIYLKEPAPLPAGIHDCGVNGVFEGVAGNLGVTKLLKSYFPENYKEIMTVAQYMLGNGNVMYYLQDYTETHKTPLQGMMDGRRSSKMFASLRQEDMLLFFREWMKRKRANEYVAYDVTSISSYAKNMDALAWGYNRDKEKLPQLNMGVYYGEESRLPLYYRVYPGCISDKSHLRYMVADNEFINGKRTRYVMDRGFYSAENLNYLVQNGYRFVIALPGSLKYCKELICKHRNELVNHSECMLGQGLPYGKAYEVNELGFRMKVHLYYDPQKALRESEALYELIQRQENDLRSMEEPPEKRLHYDRFFFINRSKEGKLGFVKNHNAINAYLENCGFFFIAETDFRKTSGEILNIYRNRNVVEQNFDQLKNELDMKRLHCHNSETANGKIFVAFIALIIKAQMENKLAKYMAEKNVTFPKLLLELDKIKCLDLNGKSKPRTLNPLTRTQKDILTLLELDAECIG